MIKKTVTALAASVLAMTAHAHDHDKEKSKVSGQSMETEQMKSQKYGEPGNQTDPKGVAMEQRSLSGKILKTKTVEIKGSDEKHKVALISVDEKRMVVDLGDEKNLKKASLKDGDDITVTGQMVELGDRKVIMADKLKSGDQSYKIARAMSATQAKKMSKSSPSFTAEIKDHKIVQVKDSGEKHQLIKVSLKGKDTIVDLGQPDKLKDFPIEKGQKLKISGKATKVGDRSIIAADSITANGKTIEVDKAFRFKPNRKEG